jgi:hypothetical protein
MLVINRGAASRTAKTGLQTSWTVAKYQKNGPKIIYLIGKEKIMVIMSCIRIGAEQNG